MTSDDPGWPKLGLAGFGNALIVPWLDFWAGTVARFAIFVEDSFRKSHQ